MSTRHLGNSVRIAKVQIPSEAVIVRLTLKSQKHRFAKATPAEIIRKVLEGAEVHGKWGFDKATIEHEHAFV